MIDKDNNRFLARAKDLNKDQTYFLHEVKENEFLKCIFPLSELNKEEVRQIAIDQKLITAEKKDSVGICFVGERNLKDFLKRFISFDKGVIKDENGSVIGEHNGSILYTQGQRQGLMIGGVKGRKELPWYVYDKNIFTNEIFVCQGVDNELLMRNDIKIRKLFAEVIAVVISSKRKNPISDIKINDGIEILCRNNFNKLFVRMI